MSLIRAPHDVLCVTSELELLKNRWGTENRARVFATTAGLDTAHNYTPSNGVTSSNTTSPFKLVDTHSPMSQLLVRSRAGPSMVESYQRVVASRLDLPSIDTIQTSVCIGQPIANINHSTRPTRVDCATAMAKTETEIITSVCNTFLAESPPYNGKGGTIDTSVPPDVVSHACCAYVTPVGANTSKRIYLQMAAPTREQIGICSKDETYNKNVQLNVTSALGGHNIPVVFSQLTTSSERGTLQINPDMPVKPLGTTKCCEDLLFGATRITSSPNFSIGVDVGATYATAVRKYQSYGNVSIGEQITLVPMINKRAPMVVSMSCPQLNMSEVITGVSGQQTHSRFGPNHAARAVEVLAKLVPFVQRCCEVSMNLPRETVEDLQEDNDMPIPKCKSLEHCFAHDPGHGVGAYVATHEISIPTAVLNTHIVGHNPSITPSTASTPSTVFPLEQHITVHVAALFSGAVTDRCQ